MGWKESAGYQLYEQKQRSSCGMACVAMVVHRKGMGTPNEGMLATKSSKMARGYKAGFGDRMKSMGVTGPRMLTATAEPAQAYEGTYMENLSALLDEWNIKNTCSLHAQVMASLRLVRQGSPAIAQVNWAGGNGSHFVMIEKYMADAPLGLIVCDPYYGVTAVSATGSASYRASDGTMGTFSGWLITT